MSGGKQQRPVVDSAGGRSWSHGRKADVFPQPRTLGKWAWFQEEGRNSQRVLLILLPEVRPMVYKAPVMRLLQRHCGKGDKMGSMGQRTTRNIFRWLEEKCAEGAFGMIANDLHSPMCFHLTLHKKSNMSLIKPRLLKIRIFLSNGKSTIWDFFMVYLYLFGGLAQIQVNDAYLISLFSKG